MKKLIALLKRSKLANPSGFFLLEVIAAIFVGWIFYSTAKPIIIQLSNLITEKIIKANEVQRQMAIVDQLFNHYPPGITIDRNVVMQQAQLYQTDIFEKIISNPRIKNLSVSDQDYYYRNQLLNLKINLLEKLLIIERPAYGVWLSWRSFVMWVCGILFTQLITDISKLIIRAYKNLQKAVQEHME